MKRYLELSIGLVLCLALVHIVVSQHLPPGQLKSKVDEIAKAYAEGYKAALTAMRARSMVARNSAAAAAKKSQNPMQKFNPKSFIPKPLNAQMQFQPPPNLPFNFPGRQITINGVEKSGIPRPGFQRQFARPAVPAQPQAHTVVERSAATPPVLGKFMQQQTGNQFQQQQQQRSSVPAAPAAKATPQNNAKLTEIAKLNAAARHRNVYFDSMGGDPYAGASGVLSRQHIHLNRNRRSLGYQPLPGQTFPGARRSRMPYFGQDLDKLGIIRAVPAISAPATSKTTQSFTKVPVSHVEIAKLTDSGSNTRNQVTAEKRSFVMPAQQQQQQQNYQQRTFIPAAPVASPAKRQVHQDDERSMISKLNQAAYHRNVYLDSMGGDPYGGASGLLSRQRFLISKHKRMAEEDN